MSFSTSRTRGRRARPRPRRIAGGDPGPVRGRGRRAVIPRGPIGGRRGRRGSSGADGATRTRTSAGCRGPRSSSSSSHGTTPASSRPTTTRPASGSCTPSTRCDSRTTARPFGGAAFLAQLRRGAPSLADRLRRAPRASPVRGMLRAPNQLRRAVGPGWALVGDAGYHRDAVTGHGISDAFRDAEQLAAALDRALREAGRRRVTRWLSTSCGGTSRSGRSSTSRAPWSAYPAVPEFVELTRASGPAIDAEAAALAARPVPGASQSSPAARLHLSEEQDMTTAAKESRNGVDTATLFATLDAVKAAPERPSSSSGPRNRVDQRHAQPQHHRRLLRRRRGDARTSAPSTSTPTTPRCWSVGTTARPRWSSCCTPSPRA